jgi:hypothetical protein
MTMSSQPDYVQAKPKQSDAKRVVPDGREAPRLYVSYRCPKTSCNQTAVLDAYDGPPSCKRGHSVTFMDALFITAVQS